MARMNAKMERRLRVEQDTVLNHEGGAAFMMDPYTELYQRVATSLMGEPKFYESGGTSVAEMTRLVEYFCHADPEYVLKLAAYARNTLYLRTTPQWLLAYVAARFSRDLVTEGFRIRPWVPAIVKRPDEPGEVLAAFQKINDGDGYGDEEQGPMLPNGLRRGLSDAMFQWDAYGFGKYLRNKSEYPMRDVMRLVHPVSWRGGVSMTQANARTALYRSIVDGTLAVPPTWETYVSEHGSTKETWTEILPQMPLMATLRNLRNLLDKGVDMAPAIEKITNPGLVQKSMLFPYRFFQAFKIVQGAHPRATAVLDALQTAMDISLANIPTWPGKTVVAVDVSGSMTTGTSKDGSMRLIEIASLFGAMSHALGTESTVIAFDNSAKVVPISKRDGILTNAAKILPVTNGGTYSHTVFERLMEDHIEADRVLLFSDQQNFNNPDQLQAMLPQRVAEYRARVSPRAWVYSIDLAGYGTAQLPQTMPRTALVAGYSDNILRYVPAIERGGTVVGEIQSALASSYYSEPREVDD